MNSQLNIPEKEIATLCKRYHIQRLSVFGSALSEMFSPESDLDILVEFEKGKEPGFFLNFKMNYHSFSIERLT